MDSYFEENKPYSGLGRQSARSGVVFVTARGINIFVQLASTVLLARLLTPHDFGLVAVITALFVFAPLLIDLGTTEASVQRTQITQSDISTIFWINMAIGAALTVVMAGASGVLARIFSEPSLTGISLALSVTFMMSAASTQHYALMRRAMQFRQIAIVDISANVAGSVISIAMALADWGYWSLVAKPIVTTGLSAIGVWLSCAWVPGKPKLTPAVTEMVRFGTGVTGFTMTDYVARSADRVAIGYFFGAPALGYFQNAFNVYSNLLTILTDPLHNIAVSSLSKLKNDAEALKCAWARALSTLSFFSAGAFAVLAVNAQDFVVLLLGPKWAPAGPLLCILAVRGIAQSVERTLGWIHVAVGRSDRWMRWGFISVACQLAALVAGLPFGLIGIAIAYALVMFGLFVPALVYAGRPVGIDSKDVLRSVGGQTIAGLATVATGFLLQQVFMADLSSLARFVACVPISLTIYLTIAVGAFRVTDPLNLALSVVRDFGPVRSLTR